MSMYVWIWLILTNSVNEISHIEQAGFTHFLCQSTEKGFLGATKWVCMCIAGGCLLGLDNYCRMTEVEINMTKQYRIRNLFCDLTEGFK